MYPMLERWTQILRILSYFKIFHRILEGFLATPFRSDRAGYIKPHDRNRIIQLINKYKLSALNKNGIRVSICLIQRATKTKYN